MKTLYSKFNRERNPKFQIETRISLDAQGHKVISKIPMSKEAQPHIEHMHTYYMSSMNQDMLADCTLHEGKIDFEFIRGTSFTSKLLACVESNNRSTYLNLFQEYHAILKKLFTDGEMFIPSPQFIEVFGPCVPIAVTAYKNMNVDMIFDNLIFGQDGVKVIDYEWVFPFAIPMKFVIWRAIFGFYINHDTLLHEFVKDETVYDVFDISKEDIEIFKTMDYNFLKYIYGDKRNYENILKNYARPRVDVLHKLNELEEAKQGYAQVFIDDGNGYRDTLSQTYTFIFHNNEEFSVHLSLKKYDKVAHIRFDPIPFAGIIILKEAVLIDESGNKKNIESFLHNAVVSFASYYVFETDDPQFIVHETEIEGYCEVNFSFAYLSISQFDKNIFDPLLNAYAKEVANIKEEMSKEIDALSKALNEEKRYAQQILSNKRELEKELMKTIERLKEIEI